MTNLKKLITPFVFCLAANAAFAQQQLLFDSLAKPQLISKEFSFTEGASVDKKGNVFFTDQPNDKIWEYDTNGKFSVFMEGTGRANGMYFDKKGNLIVCADQKNEVWSISPKKAVTVLLTGFEGHFFNGPNDVWVDDKGGIYITDPFYRRDYWTHPKTDIDGEKVYYLAKGAKTPIVVAGDLRKPNGIVGTPDGKHLFVADIDGNKTYKYTINADGTLSDKTLFTNQGSDGMTIDEKGNMYLATGHAIAIFGPDGKKITQIPIAEPWVANLCFGGKNKDVLFITASKAIYTMQMKVKGVE